jgi:hypothetical protein
MPSTPLPPAVVLVPKFSSIDSPGTPLRLGKVNGRTVVTEWREPLELKRSAAGPAETQGLLFRGGWLCELRRQPNGAS